MTPIVGQLLADPKGREWRVDHIDGDATVPDDCRVRVRVVNVHAGGLVTHTLTYLRRFWREVTP